jgi:hypothetical protein
MRVFWAVIGTLLLVAPGALLAQQPKPNPLPATPPVIDARITQTLHPLSYSDLYCAGYVAQPSKVERFVAGGLGAPHQSRFLAGNYIFLKGNGFHPGSRVSIVRQFNDPNRFYPFPAERRIGGASQLYADVAYAVVIEQRPTGMAVAQVEFACDEIVVGDQIVPFVARTLPAYRASSSLERFPADAARVGGRIVAARDFEQYLGSGRKVYLDLGSEQGLKTGDYFRVLRGYERRELDVADKDMHRARAADDTQKLPLEVPADRLADLPRRVIGELIVLTTQPRSATAMVTFALEDIHVGDRVELEPGPPGP